MKLVEAKNIWKIYGEDIILENLNFSMDEGEFCALVGPSGCGKTTFLRMLLGVETPSKGTLKFEAKIINSTITSKRTKTFTFR